MKRSLPLLVALAALAACAPRRVAPPTEPGVSHLDLGKVFVVEKRGPLMLDEQTVLVRCERDRETAEGLLRGLFPKLCGPAAPLGCPAVLTVSQYVAQRRRAADESRERHARERPGEPYPFPEHDYAAMRRELETPLKGRRALVLRWAKEEPGR